MATKALTRFTERMPSVFDDFFKPWNEWFGRDLFSGPTLQVPAVNITEEENAYVASLAAPGMKKEDFDINIDGNMLTISCEKEDSKEEKEKTFTRKEYNYSSFSRTFTLPDEVEKEKIDASYTDGILKINLPRNGNEKKPSSKQITVK